MHICLEIQNQTQMFKEIQLCLYYTRTNSSKNDTELKFQYSHSHYKNTQCQLPSCTFLKRFIILFQFSTLHHLQDKNTCMFHSLKCKVVTVHAMKAYGGVEVPLY